MHSIHNSTDAYSKSTLIDIWLHLTVWLKSNWRNYTSVSNRLAQQTCGIIIKNWPMVRVAETQMNGCGCRRRVPNTRIQTLVKKIGLTLTLDEFWTFAKSDFFWKNNWIIPKKPCLSEKKKHVKFAACKSDFFCPCHVQFCPIS